MNFALVMSLLDSFPLQKIQSKLLLFRSSGMTWKSSTIQFLHYLHFFLLPGQCLLCPLDTMPFLNPRPGSWVPRSTAFPTKVWPEQDAHSSVQFSSVAQSCPTLHDPMDCSMPGLPVHHQLPEFTQIHVRWVSDAIQPSYPLSSPSIFRSFSNESVLYIRWPKYCTQGSQIQQEEWAISCVVCKQEGSG